MVFMGGRGGTSISLTLCALLFSLEIGGGKEHPVLFFF